MTPCLETVPLIRLLSRHVQPITVYCTLTSHTSGLTKTRICCLLTKQKHTCRMWHLCLNWNFFKKIEIRAYFSQSHQELETTIITVIPKTLIRLIGWILMCNNHKFDFRTHDRNLTYHFIQFGNTFVKQDCTLCVCSTLTFPETFLTLSKNIRQPTFTT